MSDEESSLNDDNLDDEAEAFKEVSEEGRPRTSRAANGADDVFHESSYKLTTRWTFYNHGLCYVLGFRILLWMYVEFLM